jgi:hypothetical protein
MLPQQQRKAQVHDPGVRGHAGNVMRGWVALRGGDEVLDIDITWRSRDPIDN